MKENKVIGSLVPLELRWIIEQILLRAKRHDTDAPIDLVAAIRLIAKRLYRKLQRIIQRSLGGLKKLARTAIRKLRRPLVLYRLAREEVQLLRDGADHLIGERAVAKPGTFSAHDPCRVLYVTYNSLPYHSAGYATRSHGLVAALRARGVEAAILTRAGYPQLFEKYRSTPVPALEAHGGVPYHRLLLDVHQLFRRSTASSISMNIAMAFELAKANPPCVVHGASNFLTGLTAVGVARKLGVPSVYEVRGLWEITQVSRDPSFADTLHYAQAVKLETQACTEADWVITITDALKGVLIERGVPGHKITVVPNGVDTERFKPRIRDPYLAKKLGLLPEHVVVGYVGSMVDYEGLDDLLRAVRLLRYRGNEHLRVLIVGDGAVYDSCRKLSSDLGLDDVVRFTGRVPHEEVEAYYSLIDIAPFPRKPVPVCELVSPLKPLEAMAMGKCVVVSSVAALSEIIGDRPVGLIHEKGEVQSLANELERAANDPALRSHLGREARNFVVNERDWTKLADRVIEVYQRLGVTGPAAHDRLGEGLLV